MLNSKVSLVRHHRDPQVLTSDNFINSIEAKAMRDAAKDDMNLATVFGSEKSVTSKERTSTVAWVPHNTNPTTAQIAARISGLVGLPLSHAEQFQVISYSSGQEYRPHFDAYDPKTDLGKREMKRGGQRLVTTLCYLNQVMAGGETEFPELGIKIAPKIGRLLIFENCNKGTNVRSDMSLHAGLPVQLGVKWAFNLWFREKPIPR